MRTPNAAKPLEITIYNPLPKVWSLRLPTQQNGISITIAKSLEFVANNKNQGKIF